MFPSVQPTHLFHCFRLGFDKVVEDAKYRMSRYGVSPNVRLARFRNLQIDQLLQRCLTCVRVPSQMLIIPPQEKIIGIEHLLEPHLPML